MPLTGCTRTVFRGAGLAWRRQQEVDADTHGSFPTSQSQLRNSLWIVPFGTVVQILVPFFAQIAIHPNSGTPRSPTPEPLMHPGCYDVASRREAQAALVLLRALSEASSLLSAPVRQVADLCVHLANLSLDDALADELSANLGDGTSRGWPRGLVTHLPQLAKVVCGEPRSSQPVRHLQGGAHLPVWDATNRELWFDREVVKQLARHADAQQVVLAHFQQAGWPEEVTNPFSGPWRKAVRRLRDTVRSLNASTVLTLNAGHDQPPLQFETRASGRRVAWWMSD